MCALAPILPRLVGGRYLVASIFAWSRGRDVALQNLLSLATRGPARTSVPRANGVSWYLVGSIGARRDLWVHVTGPGKPEYGRWKSPAGHDVLKVLGESGPHALDVPVSWVQAADARGRTRTDLLWQTRRCGFKLASQRMADMRINHCPSMRVFDDVTVRLRDGESLEGYVGLVVAALRTADPDRHLHRASRWRLPGRPTGLGRRLRRRSSAVTGLRGSSRGTHGRLR